MSITLEDYKLSCELLGHNLDVRAVCAGECTESGQLIISGSRDKTTKLWKPLGNSYIQSRSLEDHKNFVSCVFYHETERWLCTGSNDASICIYKDNDMLPIFNLKGHQSTVCSIAAGVEARSIITGSWDKTARIWMIGRNEDVRFVELKGHEAAVWSVTSISGSKQFVTGSADKNIIYWNCKGEKLRLLKGHTDCVRGLLILTDSSLVSCGNDASIRIWSKDGECIRTLNGHNNYIYSVARHEKSDNLILTCGEDSTLRMWDIVTGEERGAALIHPTQSVWSVICLKNGDIATGSSDGIIRIFTMDPARCANEMTLKAYQNAVNMRKMQMHEEFGGIKKTDLPGPESLLLNGSREGQTKIIRHSDGSVKCYAWEIGKWNLVGDVTGATGANQETSGKVLYQGKEYDYVFSVDISDSIPPIKLPYNRNEDPWHAAQTFINHHSLPQVYLNQVANFIIKNSRNTKMTTFQAGTSGYEDPFTGGNRYMPDGNSTNYDLSKSQVDIQSTKSEEKYFPLQEYVTFDTCDPIKVFDKLKEFNEKATSQGKHVNDEVLEAAIKLTEQLPSVDSTSINSLKMLLNWPTELLFPVFDIMRLAVRSELVFASLKDFKYMDILLSNMDSVAANQLMIIRCLANMMKHSCGRYDIDENLSALVNSINNIKEGNNNLQIAIATFLLNFSTWQVLSKSSEEKCIIITEGLIEFLKWATEVESCCRAMQALGNLTKTPYHQEINALVVSVDKVMQKIRDFASKSQSGAMSKLNAIGLALIGIL